MQKLKFNDKALALNVAPFLDAFNAFFNAFFNGALKVAFILALVVAGCSGPGGNGERVVVFTNVTVIDAVNGSRPGQSVVVRDGSIEEVGTAVNVRTPRGASVVDCEGKFMIPGLWDAHLHLTNSNAGMPDLFPLLIASGITYVRDTGATLESILPLREIAREWADGGGLAPEVFMTGPHIDGKQLSWESSVSAVTPEQARFIVNCLIISGVNEIKVYDLIEREVALEVFRLANERGYRLSAHVPLTMDVVEASDAGLASMEHMYNLEMACSGDWDSLLLARHRMIEEGKGMNGNDLRQSIYRAQRLHSFRTQDEERRSYVLETLARNNTWQVPTLVITTQSLTRPFERESWKETFRYMPEPVRSTWLKNAESRASQPPSEEGLAHAGWAFDMIPRLLENGIGIMAGTDMPLAFLTPGFSLHEELRLLVKAGMTPLQAIEAATLRPAQYYGLEGRMGSIAPGMAADMVILDADPLENIENTLRINAVIRNGHLHAREDIDEILERLENQQ